MSRETANTTLSTKHSLDSLLPDDEPHATFHDALISTILVDYSRRRFAAEVDLCVGDPGADDEGARERRRRGQLVVEGLRVWALEAPRDLDSGSEIELWVTADGVLSESPTESGKALARQLTRKEIGWYMFFTNLDAFGYLAGERAQFHWL